MKLGTQVERRGLRVGCPYKVSTEKKKKIELVDLNTFAEEIDK